MFTHGYYPDATEFFAKHGQIKSFGVYDDVQSLDRQLHRIIDRSGSVDNPRLWGQPNDELSSFGYQPTPAAVVVRDALPTLPKYDVNGRTSFAETMLHKPNDQGGIDSVLFAFDHNHRRHYFVTEERLVDGKAHLKTLAESTDHQSAGQTFFDAIQAKLRDGWISPLNELRAAVRADNPDETKAWLKAGVSMWETLPLPTADGEVGTWAPVQMAARSGNNALTLEMGRVKGHNWSLAAIQPLDLRGLVSQLKSNADVDSKTLHITSLGLGKQAP